MTKVIAVLIALECLILSEALGAPSVGSVGAGSSVALYDKLEVTFDVSTVASNPYWPYDPAPECNTPEHPNAAPVGVGVNVDGLFLPPGETQWSRAHVQPAFYFQDYTRGDYFRTPVGPDWVYPVGDPCWKIRFTPTVIGEWRYRIRVTDAGGTTTYTPTQDTFTCTASANRGFVRVSPTDSRYFETSDGRYINFAGTESPRYVLNDQLIGTGSTYDQDTAYAVCGANGLNLIRVWWNATEQPCVFGISGQGGFWNWRDETADTSAPVLCGEAYAGQVCSMKITGDAPYKSISTSVDCRPGAYYVFSARVKTVGLTGGSAYLIVHDRVGFEAHAPISASVTGDTDWTLLHGSFQTWSTQRVVTYVNVEVSGSTDTSSVYVTDMSVREDLRNGQYGPELAWKPSFDPHWAYSQRECWRADYMTECARRNGVYLKIALQEKKDKGFCSLGPDGRYAAYDEANFYATPTHAGRTFQTYFWRYIIARYGYATNIHSFEVTNEGDPFNGMHYDAANAMARYFQENDPNAHLVATSLWHSFPSRQFWGNSDYSFVDYADWHRNVGIRTGQAPQMVYHGWQYTLKDFLDPSVSHGAATGSIRLASPADQPEDQYSFITGPTSEQFAISPNHNYTLTWYTKGDNLRVDPAHPTASPNLYIYCYNSHSEPDFPSGANWVTGTSPASGTFDWTPQSKTFDSGPTGWYLTVGTCLPFIKGTVWFSDFSLRDNTIGEDMNFPGRNLTQRADRDSALMVYALGEQIGMGTSRQVNKPVIDANACLIGDDIYGSPYGGFTFSCEDQRLIDDTEGVWYRKFIWSQVNPFGVVNLYYLNELIMKRQLYKYARAYQAFMADIPLSNGNYADAKAITSSASLRAWGQKDTANNQVHLWIDNTGCTWRNVVDRVSIPPVTGTVTVAGIADGIYRVDWWNTTTGEVTRSEDVTIAGGELELQVTGLESDTACKVYPKMAELRMRVLVPSTDVRTGRTVTVTVEYTNVGQTLAPTAVVRGRVPALMDYVAGSAEATGGVFNPETQEVSWTAYNVEGGETGTRTFQARVQ